MRCVLQHPIIWLHTIPGYLSYLGHSTAHQLGEIVSCLVCLTFLTPKHSTSLESADAGAYGLLCCDFCGALFPNLGYWSFDRQSLVFRPFYWVDYYKYLRSEKFLSSLA